MKKQVVLFFWLVISSSLHAQFTHADSLRGGYGSGRNWWDLKHYDLSVKFDLEHKELSGKNIITFAADSVRGVYEYRKVQLDLQGPMQIDSVFFGTYRLPDERIKRDGNAYFITYEDGGNTPDNLSRLTVYFHGSPRKAVNPPWDGGIIWKKDSNGKPWVSIACQGLGASVWFPCKDSQVDEPDSVTTRFTVPSGLKCISNGMFFSKTASGKDFNTFTWKVTNPINNYDIIPYIGDYVNIHEHYKGEKGNLELDYWVLRGNEEKARTHFQEVPRMLEALEYWFGPYPFYEDGYKLVEAPHLGMEHQSAIAYGNRYQNGYMGKDLSETGEGLKWDFIIVHESGHEWYGNSITSKDVADMWVHEGFTNYSEVLFMDYWFGTKAADTYCIGLRKNIRNDKPIIGAYHVQNEGSGDMYYKGSNMLHTIRTLTANDSLFRAMLRDMNRTFYHQTVSSAQIEQFMSEKLGMDLHLIFDQYLRTNTPPTLQIKEKKGKIRYRWINVVKGFHMPILFGNQQANCTTKWSKWTDKQHEKELNPNLYYLLKKN